jgi:peptidoglycan/LPS O-acetylase OafA/YrhL
MIQKLRRVTSSGQYIAEIDGLRFLAIAPVVLIHLRNYMLVKSSGLYSSAPEANWLARLTAHGHYGVELFFVISGFVLALPFASHYLRGKKAVRLRDYFLRRLTRLEPPYIVCMLLCFGLFLLLGKGTSAELSGHAIAGVFYVHSLVFGDLNPLNLVTWSLEVEIQFYLLVPILARLFGIRGKVLRRLTLAMLILVLILAQSFVPAEALRFKLSIANYLQYFLAGFLLADIYVADWDAAPTHHWKWDLLSIIGWPALFLIFEHANLTHYLLPVALLALFYSAFRGVYFRRLLTLPLITIVGGMCYTIYLIHIQVLSLAGKYRAPIMISDNFSVNFVPELLLFLPVLAVFTVIYFSLIERPCMQKDWLKRAAARLREIVNREGKVKSPDLAS